MLDHQKKCLIGTLDRKNRITFSDVPLLSGNFQRNDPKRRVYLLCNRNCPKLFVNCEPPLCHPAWPQYTQRSWYIPAPYTFRVAIPNQIQFMIC